MGGHKPEVECCANRAGVIPVGRLPASSKREASCRRLRPPPKGRASGVSGDRGAKGAPKPWHSGRSRSCGSTRRPCSCPKRLSWNRKPGSRGCGRLAHVRLGPSGAGPRPGLHPLCWSLTLGWRGRCLNMGTEMYVARWEVPAQGLYQFPGEPLAPQGWVGMGARTCRPGRGPPSQLFSWPRSTRDPK